MNLSSRVSAFALILACLAVPDPFSSASAAESTCGDVNKSGTVTSGDALAVLRKSVGQSVQLACPPPATPLKTGQTTCYTPTGNPLSCPGSTEDGDFQKGASRDFTDNGDGTITDNATGLMWEKLSNDGGYHDRDTLFSWANAVEKAKFLNDIEFAGHDDWRLPNQFELFSLVHLGTGTPANDPLFHTPCPPGCTVLDCSCTATTDPVYWSSTTYLNGTSGTGAWAVQFDGGFTVAVDKTFGIYARVVRDAP